MLSIPKTKEEARQYQYNRWAGNPNGNKYDETRCAYEVSSGFCLFNQCSRKNGKGLNGLFCGIHAKKINEG